MYLIRLRKITEKKSFFLNKNVNFDVFKIIIIILDHHQLSQVKGHAWGNIPVGISKFIPRDFMSFFLFILAKIFEFKAVVNDQVIFC